jgi:hypothetical protein
VPYIKTEDRLNVAFDGAENVADLTFVLYQTVTDYVRRRNTSLRFQSIADVLGALEATKLEFYRRTAVPYEDMKLSQNGDV